jgi:hypothetical protein
MNRSPNARRLELLTLVLCNAVQLQDFLRDLQAVLRHLLQA